MIHVSAFDIERGRRGYPYQPIARAVWKRTIDGTLVKLIWDEVMICNAGRRFWCKLPPRAIEFTNAFNERLHVDPISFKIAIPENLLRKRKHGARDTTAFPFYDPPQTNESVDYRT